MLRSKISLAAAFAFGMVVAAAQPAQANDAQRLLNQFLGMGEVLGQQPQRDRNASSRARRDRQAASTQFDLYAVQVRLRELGYDVGEPDGRPGSRTRAAIRQYQSDNNFEATGELSGVQAERLERFTF